MKNEKKKTRKSCEIDEWIYTHTRKKARILKLTQVITVKIHSFSSLKMVINKNEKYLSA